MELRIRQEEQLQEEVGSRRRGRRDLRRSLDRFSRGGGSRRRNPTGWMARSGGAGRRTAREDRGHAEHGGVDIITGEERRL